jgi:hypothetical protein
MRVPAIGSAAVALVVAGCGASAGSGVVKVSVSPWPEGPGPVVAATKPLPGVYVPLKNVESAIPKTMPENPPQTCGFGAKVEVTLEDGRTLTYGPCNRPALIERLRLALVRAAEHEQAGPAPHRRTSSLNWKSVIRDWYDGTIDHWHSCAAVREAIKHLPTTPPMYSTVYDDLRAYEHAVC